MPTIGLDSRDAERGVLALVAFGIATVGDCGGRRSSRCSASCSSRTGSRSPRSSCPAASSLAIELGVALDLTLVALVAAVFHERIFAEFGAGDTRGPEERCVTSRELLALAVVAVPALAAVLVAARAAARS